MVRLVAGEARNVRLESLIQLPCVQSVVQKEIGPFGCCPTYRKITEAFAREAIKRTHNSESQDVICPQTFLGWSAPGFHKDLASLNAAISACSEACRKRLFV